MNIFHIFSHFHYLLSSGMWEKRLCAEEAKLLATQAMRSKAIGDAGLRVVRPRVQQLHALLAPPAPGKTFQKILLIYD